MKVKSKWIENLQNQITLLSSDGPWKNDQKGENRLQIKSPLHSISLYLKNPFTSKTQKFFNFSGIKIQKITENDEKIWLTISQGV